MTAPISSSLLVAPIVAGLNHVLKAEPALLLRAQAQAGKHIQWRVAPLPSQMVSIESSGFFVGADPQDPPDLAIDVQWVPVLFGKWSRDALRDQLQFNGDEVLTTLVRDAVQCASWDIEDELAKLIGDIPAHRLGTAARALQTGAAEGTERIAQNVAEYLAHERKVLVASAHLATLADDLSRVTARLDALESRVNRIDGS